MKNYLIFICIYFFFTVITQLQSVAQTTVKYYSTISRIDSDYYGIWKMKEDTNYTNFFLLQSSYDHFHKMDIWFHTDSVEKLKFLYSSHPKQEVDDHLVPMGFLHNDTVEYLQDYKKFLKNNGLMSYLSYFNYHGQNQLYEMWTTFFAKIGNNNYFIVAKSKDLLHGYSYARLISINKTKDSLTLGVSTDTTLKHINSTQVLSKRLVNNISNPKFPEKILHFYKVSGYHVTVDGAIKTNEQLK